MTARQASQRGGSPTRLGAVIAPPPSAPPQPSPKACEACGADVQAIWLWFARPERWHHPKLCATCHGRLQDAKSAERLEDQRRQWLTDRIERAGLNQARREQTFETFLDRPGTATALATARQFARSIAAGDQPEKGRLFVGDNGSGKTHLVTAILGHVLDANPTVTGLFVEFAEYLSALRESFDAGPEAEVTPGSLRQVMATVDLLVLDDLGAAASRGSGWDAEEMVRLLNRRAERGAVLVATADVVATRLEKMLGPRVVSRLYGMCRVVRVEATDYRREGSEHGRETR